MTNITKVILVAWFIGVLAWLGLVQKEPINPPLPPPPPPVCADGIYNDGDRLVDSNDPGCSNPTDNDEANSPKPSPPPPAPPPCRCHPSYSGCLMCRAGDYDCAGGLGDGPNFTGLVRVLGPDVFRLDRDGDGWGCDEI